MVHADDFEHGWTCDQAHFAEAKTERDHDDYSEAKTEQGWHADYLGHIRASSCSFLYLSSVFVIRASASRERSSLSLLLSLFFRFF